MRMLRQLARRISPYFLTRKWQWMSHAGKIQAAWRSYQRIEAQLISLPALSSKKLPPNVNRVSTISKDTDEPTNEAKSLPVKYSKLETVRWRR